MKTTRRNFLKLLGGAAASAPVIAKGDFDFPEPVAEPPSEEIVKPKPKPIAPPITDIGVEIYIGDPMLEGVFTKLEHVTEFSRENSLHGIELLDGYIEYVSHKDQFVTITRLITDKNVRDVMLDQDYYLMKVIIGQLIYGTYKAFPLSQGNECDVNGIIKQTTIFHLVLV